MHLAVIFPAQRRLLTVWCSWQKRTSWHCLRSVCSHTGFSYQISLNTQFILLWISCYVLIGGLTVCLLKQEHPMVNFGVTVDGRFLPKPAEELLQSQQFNKVPLIMGITNDECGYLLPNVKIFKNTSIRFVFPKLQSELYGTFTCVSVVILSSRMDRWDGLGADLAIIDHA